MPFTLYIERGGGTTVMRQVAGGTLRIGRGTNADLRLDQPQVALEHAVITSTAEGFVLEDLGSAAGTRVAGEPLEQGGHRRLEDGDEIEIGGFRLGVELMRLAAEGEPRLLLRVAPRVAAAAAVGEPRSRSLPLPPPVPARGAPRAVDYAAAYRLGRGGLSKKLFSLAAVAAALAASAMLVAGDRQAAFRPGEVSAGHASVIGASSCLDCHVPFAGPAEQRCTECHADVPHQQTAVLPATAGACGDCHFEHRGLERLTLVSDGACASCHRDLTAVVGPGVQLAVSAGATSFGGDHPPFDLPATDDNSLSFPHAEHLEPLRVPEGTVTLECGDCHLPAAGEDGLAGRMRPVSFEQHCQRCHLLTFDPGLPTEQVPHEAPPLVAAYVLRAFAGGSEWRGMTFEERRRLIVTDPERNRNYRVSTGERRAANQAEGYLFGTVCPECHRLEPRGALPEVAPVRASRDWLPAGRFPHDRHGTAQRLECLDCHAGATASTTTADVLLPGIDTCRECHGRGAVERARAADPAAGAAERAPAERIRSGCVDCHGYHQTSAPQPVRSREASRRPLGTEGDLS